MVIAKQSEVDSESIMNDIKQHPWCDFDVIVTPDANSDATFIKGKKSEVLSFLMAYLMLADRKEALHYLVTK
jgi:hypothetical protein